MLLDGRRLKRTAEFYRRGHILHGVKFLVGAVCDFQALSPTNPGRKIRLRWGGTHVISGKGAIGRDIVFISATLWRRPAFMPEAAPS